MSSASASRHAAPPAASGLLPLLAAALLLAATAACTPAVPPAETPPAPATGTAAASAPNYMADHVARDAALEQALLGSWHETDTLDDGAAIEGDTTYAPDHTLSFHYRGKRGADSKPAAFAGTWSVQHGFLTYTLTVYGKAETSTDEILRLDAQQFVYVDAVDKKTKIATRQPAGQAIAAAALPAVAPTAAVVPLTAAPPPDGALLADENLFVAEKATETYVFRLDDAAQIRLTAEIAERVPLNVIVLPGRITEERFAMAVGNLTLGRLVPLYEDSKIKGVASLDDFFASRLSKRAAFGRFDSPWVTLAPGTYTVLLDNWGELSPTRGDAPVHLRLYQRPVS